MGLKRKFMLAATISFALTVAVSVMSAGLDVTKGSASDPSLDAVCIQKATVMPRIDYAKMIGRGNPHEQQVDISAWNKSLTRECDPSYKRVVKATLFMKKANERRVKIKKDGIHTGNESALGTIGRSPGGHNGWPAKLLYECSPGGLKTKVYGVIDRALIEKATGKIVARKIGRVSIEVTRPGPC